VGGVSEVVEMERSGILVKERNPDLFAAALLELLADPKRMSDYGKRAKALATTKFDLEASATAFEGLYYRLINARRR
jgi:glycosyltransferase involved in cell wall biosynthesis